MLPSAGLPLTLDRDVRGCRRRPGLVRLGNWDRHDGGFGIHQRLGWRKNGSAPLKLFKRFLLQLRRLLDAVLTLKGVEFGPLAGIQFDHVHFVSHESGGQEHKQIEFLLLSRLEPE